MKIAVNDLELYAYTNEKLLESAPKGIVLSFIGLGGNTRMITEDPEEAVYYASKGILYVNPYINPWAWMNRTAVSLTDAVVEALFEKYALPADFPLISTGGSMGGLCALTYCYHAKKTPTACAANCPVCDLPYHYTERPDLPRTLVSAFGEYDMPLEEAMETASPYHLAEKMPDIPYYIVHCTADQAVNKEKHSDRMVERLKKAHDVTYVAMPDRGHCDLTQEGWDRYHAFVLEKCGL